MVELQNLIVRNLPVFFKKANENDTDKNSEIVKRPGKVKTNAVRNREKQKRKHAKKFHPVVFNIICEEYRNDGKEVKTEKHQQNFVFYDVLHKHDGES